MTLRLHPGPGFRTITLRLGSRPGFRAITLPRPPHVGRWLRPTIVVVGLPRSGFRAITLRHIVPDCLLTFGRTFRREVLEAHTAARGRLSPRPCTPAASHGPRRPGRRGRWWLWGASGSGVLPNRRQRRDPTIAKGGGLRLTALRASPATCPPKCSTGQAALQESKERSCAAPAHHARVWVVEVHLSVVWELRPPRSSQNEP